MTQKQSGTAEQKQQFVPLAYRVEQIPQKVLPISRSSLYLEIKRGKIFPTRLNLISHEEILRYLRDEVKLATRRTKRNLSEND